MPNVDWPYQAATLQLAVRPTVVEYRHTLTLFSDKKYHPEHFTCSLCPTLLRPQDSYFEHAGDVYCYFHYSVLFAIKCAGCNTAILKQFVGINCNIQNECWHSECYMINKVRPNWLTVERVEK